MRVVGIIVPKFNAKQHRWRDTLYILHLTSPIDDGVLLVDFICEAFFGLRMRRSDLAVVPKIFLRT